MQLRLSISVPLASLQRDCGDTCTSCNMNTVTLFEVRSLGNSTFLKMSAAAFSGLDNCLELANVSLDSSPHSLGRYAIPEPTSFYCQLAWCYGSHRSLQRGWQSGCLPALADAMQLRWFLRCLGCIQRRVPYCNLHKVNCEARRRAQRRGSRRMVGYESTTDWTGVPSIQNPTTCTTGHACVQTRP